MTKFLKIFIIFSILSIFTYFVYPIIKNRYFNPAPTAPIENSLAPTPSTSTAPTTSENPAEETAPASLEDSLSGKNTVPADPNAILNLNERGTPDSENLAHITTEHCDNNCDAFSLDFNLLEYCQQVCGIAPIKDVSNCDNKSDIEKDYCLKDLAIGKKDSKLCEGILDANIKLTCQNRILEDSLESQPRSESPDF